MVTTNSIMHKHNQLGFTLIELIMVIVILGILSAFALPKFADFSSDAEKSSIEGARGAVKSSSAIAHAQYLADGTSPGEVVLEDITVIMVEGYPTANDAVVNICNAAGLDAVDYTCETTSGDGTDGSPRVMTIKLADKDCGFTYTEPDSDGTPAAPAIGALVDCS